MPAENSGRMLLSLPAASARGCLTRRCGSGQHRFFLRRQVHWQHVAVVEMAGRDDLMLRESESRTIHFAIRLLGLPSSI